MPGESDPNPGRTERLRDEFLRLVKGEPDYSQYSRSLFSAIREGIDSFATRAPHFGALQSFPFLEVEERDGEELRYNRANFARGRLILRVGLDAEGKIVRFQVTHI